MTILRNYTKQGMLRSVSSAGATREKMFACVLRVHCLHEIVSSHCQLPASGLFSSPWRVEVTPHHLRMCCHWRTQHVPKQKPARNRQLRTAGAGSHIPDSLISSVPRRTLLLLLPWLAHRCPSAWRWLELHAENRGGFTFGRVKVAVMPARLPL